MIFKSKESRMMLLSMNMTLGRRMTVGITDFGLVSDELNLSALKNGGKTEEFKRESLKRKNMRSN
jgi:hypothetical protein